MDSRNNKLLLGIILLLFGVLSLFRFDTYLNLGTIVMLFAGLSLLLLYRTKRKDWSLLVGSYLTYIGATGFINHYIPGAHYLNIFGAMFFIVPGVVFMILYLDKKRYNLLTPASFLLWFGAILFFNDMPFIDVLPFNFSFPSMFFLFIGGSCLTVYCLGSNFKGRIWKTTGMIFMFLFAFSLITSFNFGRIFGNSVLFGKSQQIIGIALILISAYIIISALKKKKNY